MKTTGMVRRIDELGRIVIPKEIRKQLKMTEGESVAFSLEDEKVVLTKFSMLHKISPMVQILLENLEQKYQNSFMITDDKQVLMCSKDALAQYQKKKLDSELSLLLNQQEEIVEKEMDFFGTEEKVTVIPLISEQKSLGSLIMLTKRTPYYKMDETLITFIKGVIEQEIEHCA